MQPDNTTVNNAINLTTTFTNLSIETPTQADYQYLDQPSWDPNHEYQGLNQQAEGTQMNDLDNKGYRGLYQSSRKPNHEYHGIGQSPVNNEGYQDLNKSSRDPNHSCLAIGQQTGIIQMSSDFDDEEYQELDQYSTVPSHTYQAIGQQPGNNQMNADLDNEWFDLEQALFPWTSASSEAAARCIAPRRVFRPAISGWLRW